MSVAAAEIRSQTGAAPPWLAEQAVCLDISLRKPGRRRKIEPSWSPAPLPPGLPIHMTVDLFESETYREIERVDQRIRAFLRSTALPFPMRSGVYLVPVSRRQETEEELDGLLERRDQLQRRFLEDYPALRKKALSTLGRAIFDAVFPGKLELQEAFEAEKRFSSLDERMAGLWVETGEEIKQSLRGEFMELVETFAASLGTTPEGRNRPVRTTTVAKIFHFLRTFKDRNIVGDPELEELVERVNAIFDSLGAGDGAEAFVPKARERENRNRIGREIRRTVMRKLQDLSPPPDKDGVEAGGTR